MAPEDFAKPECIGNIVHWRLVVVLELVGKPLREHFRPSLTHCWFARLAVSCCEILVLVDVVGDYANATVESGALKNGIISIGDMAFMGSSSLKSVNIPSTVTSIGSNAFYGCTSLEKIIIGENVKSIGSDTFTNCTAAIYVKKGSYAEQYCTQNGLDYLLAK